MLDRRIDPLLAPRPCDSRKLVQTNLNEQVIIQIANEHYNEVDRLIDHGSVGVYCNISTCQAYAKERRSIKFPSLDMKTIEANIGIPQIQTAPASVKC